MQKCALGTYAGSEDPDQPARLRSLIRVFTPRLRNHWILLNISLFNKDPYQVLQLPWLTRIFTVPICPEDTCALGATFYWLNIALNIGTNATLP